MLDLRVSKSVFIYTYGCQMNEHDSEKILGHLSRNGYHVSENPENADLIIFNTCAIREKAEQKFYSQLGRTKLLKRNKNNLMIAVAGCVAQDAKNKIFKRAPFVDFVVGPQNIHMLNELIGQKKGILIHENPQIAMEEFSSQRGSSIKAWVNIMFGCNNFCSYCIVPYTRGREISRPSSHLIEEIRRLYESGYKEVTLLGQNVNSYKSDMDFVALLRKISSIPINRIRFVTSHPRDLSEDLITAMSELPNVCEHLHLPLQSGSDRVLKLMNRGYTYAEYSKKIRRLKEKIPGISITTDIIAGFPGEEYDEYMDTVKALSELEFDGIFAFKYSARKGTKAYEMEDQIPDDIKGDRLNNILKIQEDITYTKNIGLEGTTQEILIEGKSETNSEMLMGRTRTNKIVTVPELSAKVGEISKVKILKARLHSLDGKIINS